MDLLVAAETIRRYINNGEGIFDRVELFSQTVDYPNSLYLGDIDGDGDRDMPFANTGGSPTEIGVGWYRN